MHYTIVESQSKPLTDQERQRIKEAVIELLEEDTEFRARVYQLVVPAELRMIADEIRQLRLDFKAYSEAQDRRFEALISEMNRRFEEVNKRFEEVDRRFEALISEMNRRFEEVNKRFEEMDKRFEAILEQIREIRVELAGLAGRLGRGFEDLIRQTLKAVVGVEVKEVKRLVMWDEKGEVYGHPENVEFDAYASNSEKFLIEVKSNAKRGDILIFNKKAEWAEKTIGKARKILITAYIDDTAYRECLKLGINVISRNIVPQEREDTLRL